VLKKMPQSLEGEDKASEWAGGVKPIAMEEAKAPINNISCTEAFKLLPPYKVLYLTCCSLFPRFPTKGVKFQFLLRL
jgi:hypothetical protein